MAILKSRSEGQPSPHCEAVKPRFRTPHSTLRIPHSEAGAPATKNKSRAKQNFRPQFKRMINRLGPVIQARAGYGLRGKVGVESAIMQIRVQVDGEEYVARRNGPRTHGQTIPQYIENGKALARLAWLGGEAKHFYFNERQTHRVYFELNGIWWYIDKQELYDSLFDLQEIRFVLVG